MYYDFQHLREFVEGPLAGVSVPDEVQRIFQAADAALSVGDDGAHDRMIECVRTGDVDGARKASETAAVQRQVDTDGIQITAHDAARAALKAPSVWHDLRAAYKKAGDALVDSLKHANPASPPGLLAPLKAREAFVALPATILRLEQLAGIIKRYYVVVLYIQPHAAEWHGAELPLLVADDAATRRAAYDAWIYQPPGEARPTVGERLVTIAQLGARLEAPEEPAYHPWDLPQMIDGVDPLTATHEEVAAAVARVQSRSSAGWF